MFNFAAQKRKKAESFLAFASTNSIGKMPEWSNGPHSKCGKRVTLLPGFESLSFRRDILLVLLSREDISFLCGLGKLNLVGW